MTESLLSVKRGEPHLSLRPSRMRGEAISQQLRSYSEIASSRHAPLALLAMTRVVECACAIAIDTRRTCVVSARYTAPAIEVMTAALWEPGDANNV